jgi:TonB family protein
MKSIYGAGVRMIVLTILACPVALAQNGDQVKAAEPRPVWITLKSGDVYTGTFVRMDNISIVFKVNDDTQIKLMSDVIQIRFDNSVPLTVEGDPAIRVVDQTTAADAPVDIPTRSPSSPNQKLTILYQEKARYTDEARRNEVQGSVVLNVMFSYDGTIQSIRVVRELPYGLTENAIEAAKKIKFNPAIKNGEPVSVRGDLEFKFNLDLALPPPELSSPRDNEVITTDLRRVVLQWEPVPGARRYKVRIEKESRRPGRWTLDHNTEVTTPTYEFDTVGAVAWRWKVEAINAADRDGRWSEWRTIRFIKKIE